MGDKVTINGLSNSGIDVQNLIEKLVQVKQIRIDNVINSNELMQQKIGKLNEFKAMLREFQDLTKSVFDYRSPFNEMLANSSNESILTATAERNAEIGIRKLKVVQTARSEKWASDLLSVKHKVGKVAFSVTSGDETKKVTFNGGSVIDFVKELKKQAGDIITVNTTYKDKDNLYITIESKNEGEKNVISFSEEANSTLIDLGFLTKDKRVSSTYGVNDFDTTTSSGIIKTNNGYKLTQDQYVKINMNDKLKDADNVILTFDIDKKEATRDKNQSASIDGKPVDTIGIDEVSVDSDKIVTDKIADNSNVTNGPLTILVEGENGTKEINIQNPQKGFKIDKNSLGIGEIKNISIKNSVSDEYTVSNIEIKKEVTNDGLRPKNLIQEARNSIIEVDGIRIEKDTNTIDDVIKGVTLNLKNESTQEVEVNVDHDFEYIKNKVIEWVGKYNEMIGFIKEQTSTDQGEDGKVKGKFVGDITFMFLHNSLQKTMANDYQTNDEFELLAQLGISTGKPGSTPAEMGGYLEINEEELDQAIKSNPEAIEKLFGFDSDNDLIHDSGVGVKLVELMKGMTDLGYGAITNRVKYFETNIDRNKKTITTMERRLENYKDQLIYKFAAMEQMVSSLKSQGNYISNYFASSSGQQKK